MNLHNRVENIHVIYKVTLELIHIIGPVYTKYMYKA